MGLTVRPERPEDAAAIGAVHRACFPTADEARLVEELRKDGALCVSLVADVDGAVVGHVAWSPLQTPGGVGLAPVAVLEPHRRGGVAAALIREGLARVTAQGFAFAVVLGEPSYYGRFGFTAARGFGLADEYGGGDAFQVLALRPDGIPRGAGVVRYAQAFARLGEGA